MCLNFTLLTEQSSEYSADPVYTIITYDQYINEIFKLEILPMLPKLYSPFIINYSDDLDLFFYYSAELFLSNLTLANLEDYTPICSWKVFEDPAYYPMDVTILKDKVFLLYLYNNPQQ